MKLCKYVNQYLLPELGFEGSICERTMAWWLSKLSFCVCNVQKGVYVDGHEWEEVIAARKKYIEFMEKEVFLWVADFLWVSSWLTGWYHRYSSTYILKEGVMVEKPPTLKPGEQECHVIAHDEVCFHANDLSWTEWVADGKQPLWQKGLWGRLFEDCYLANRRSCESNFAESQSIARHEGHPMFFYRYLVVLTTANEGRRRSRLSGWRLLFRQKWMRRGELDLGTRTWCRVLEGDICQWSARQQARGNPKRLILGSYSKVPTTIYTGTTLCTDH